MTSTSHTKPQSLKPSRSRVSPFIVVLSGRVVFSADTLSAAAAWRDGRGMGCIFQMVTTPSGKVVRS